MLAPISKPVKVNVSRSVAEVVERRVMVCTAYTAGFESTGKVPSDSDYGQVAISTPNNPVYAKEWYTIAAPPSIPIGTKIYIPYFVDKPNRGVFVVEDRGGQIKGDRLDVFMEKREDALEFGKRDLEVWVRY